MRTSLAQKVLPRAFREECQHIFEKHNHRIYSPRKRVPRNCSTATRNERSTTILLCFATLFNLGFKLQSPTHLREKHIHVLCEHWSLINLAARTLHTRLSMLRVFSSWIGKSGLVRAIEFYFPGQEDLIHRHTVAQMNLSWEANGINAEEVIDHAREIDEVMACCLGLQHAFGLRVKESIELNPRKATDYDRRFLYVTDGTKGGRPRFIEIKSEYQCQKLEQAIALADRHGTGRIRWPDLDWEQAQGRYYHYCGCLGISKSGFFKVTSHGLRHEYAQKTYTDRTGLPPPISGGAPADISVDEHRRASIDVSRELGHGRIGVTTAYCGSYGHQLRGRTKSEENPSESGA